VASVQITKAENFGIAGRGRFYEETGAIRDVIQNHMLQVAALLAMEAPSQEDPDSMRDTKALLLKSIRPLDPAEIVRGQYRGYREEEEVAPDSQVETFAALRLHIDNWRWAGVPFYIRAGTKLPVTATEVLVELRRPPQVVFGRMDQQSPNYFRFRLSPDVFIAICAQAKEPGEHMVGEEAELVVRHMHGDVMTPYERLLGEAMQGDPTLFTREDSVEAAWAVVDPILHNPPPVQINEPGTWGPDAAADIIAPRNGWANPEPNPPA
jgi:glucose-6-phosphate 1-dehydrogenase